MVHLEKSNIEKTLKLKNNKHTCSHCGYMGRFIIRSTWGQKQKICARCGGLHEVVRPKL